MADSSVPIWFKIKYHDDVVVLAQQKQSLLKGTVRTDPDHMSGKYGYFDRLGAVVLKKKLTRFGDTPIDEQPHSRRRIALQEYENGWPIDRFDFKRAMDSGGGLADKYVANGVRAANRTTDDIIIAAASGNAYSVADDETQTAVALPSAQKIAAGSAGLTLNKVEEVREKLALSNVDDDEEFFFLVGAKQATNMFGITEYKSSDFNGQKPLTEGRLIKRWMGFTWIETQRLTLSGNDRLCLAYAKSGLGFVDGEIITEIDALPTKSYAKQAYVALDADATRIEDVKVVEVSCDETV